MWTLGSVLFLVLVGSSVSGSSGLIIISAKPGQNITLPCGDPNINQDLVLEWTRSDLQEKYVLVYRDEHVDHAGQHEFFKNRVFLNNTQMKDGDLSVVLKNVEINDTGRYECRVRQRNDPQRELKLISTIHLLVSPPDLTSAKPRDDIILPCGDPNTNQVLVFEWIRSDLKEDEYVFVYRDERVDLAGQHESFKNRVFLKNSQMKDGDLSVVLKNLTIEDSGRYECRVRQRRSKRSADQHPISIINLQVSPPGKEEQGGVSRGHLGLMAASVLVVLVLLPVVLWISKKKRSSIQSSIKQQNPEDEDCI